MSNEKLRHWIYVAIFIALLGALAWFILLRDPGITQESVTEVLKAQEQSFADVADYLIAKKYTADILTLPSVDNHGFGIPGEDTNEYRAYIDGLNKLMEKEGALTVHTDGNYVLFVFPAQGGLLAQKYFVIAKNADWKSIPGENPTKLAGDWQYYVIEGKPPYGSDR